MLFLYRALLCVILSEFRLETEFSLIVQFPEEPASKAC